ncbi:GntR family transcriptional regulator [Corynebacterium epidermidicanis]|uniref:Transcriptional regulator n=1 Tax=Corynebacterium epidermidicanis TaxID=1050174 RepID=A0A0G3GRA8_9CORY|nr:GntR family transcriptional regulator [Corynebacterium epidermidicanis]AKK03721.1 transcriptional regulator [Corynebacterium epidermidicanis]
MKNHISRADSLTNQVMTHVRAAVADGSMSSGEWYSVYQLSQELGVSRSPVRDALLRLEEAGLITFARNRGFQIRETTAADVAEIFAIRLALEPAAARRAAELRTEAHVNTLQTLLDDMSMQASNKNAEAFFNLDQAFHGEILSAGSSLRSREIIDRLRISTRLIGVSTAGTSRTLEDIHREHEPIFLAIEAQYKEGAAEAMRAHLQTTGKLLLQQASPEMDAQQVSSFWAQYTD